MTSNQVLVKMVLDRWYSNVKNFETALTALSDDQLQMEVAPGKNRGIYLLGHLVAVHDDMLPLLNLGDKLYPALYEPFIKSPDKSVNELPAAKTLREYSAHLNELLAQKFEQIQPDEWFLKHNAVSAEDYIKEPHRNRLNIVLTRTTHLSYHIGQLILLK